MEITSATTQTIPTFDEVWKSHKNLIYKIALSYNVGDVNRQDLIQCGRIGIHRAIQTFQPEKKGKFISWVITYVRKEMGYYLDNNLRMVRIPANEIYNKEREAQPTDNMYSLDDTFLDTGDALYSTIAYDDEEYTETDTSELRKAINKLKPKHKQIMLLFSDGKDGKEIGELLGISKQAVSSIKIKAIEKLKEIMIK